MRATFFLNLIFVPILSVVSSSVLAQIVSKSNTSYIKVLDSVFLNHDDRVDSVWIGYDFSDSEGTSIMVYKYGEEKVIYKNVLACYRCKEKNAPGYTYGGYRKNGNIVGFAQIDFLHIDTIYVDFSLKEPVIKKIVMRSYDNDIASYQYVPRKKMTIEQYGSISLTKDAKLYFNIELIKWKPPLPDNIKGYQLNCKWLSNYLITDTVSLAKNEQVYIGYDYRDAVSIIIYSKNNKASLYRNILFENMDSVERHAKSIGINAQKYSSKIVVFTQEYSQNRDSIYINFEKEPAVYDRIVHLSNKHNHDVLILPKIDVPIVKARTLFGDIYTYPRELKNKLFVFKEE